MTICLLQLGFRVQDAVIYSGGMYEDGAGGGYWGVAVTIRLQMMRRRYVYVS